MSGPINPSVISAGEAAVLSEDIADTGSVKRQGQTASGEKVQNLHDIESPLEQIMEAYEEVSAEVAEKAARYRPFEKVRTGKQDIYEKWRQLKKLLNVVPDYPDKEALLELPNRVLEFFQAKPEATADDLIKFLKSEIQSDDPTHLYVALKFLKENFADQAQNKSVLSLVSRAISSLVSNAGSAIKAGLNVSVEAAKTVQKTAIGTVNSLRNDYRETIVQFKAFTKTLNMILTKYGPNFLKGVAYLHRAIGADMMAAKTSISVVKLEEIRDGIHQMASLNTVYGASKKLLERTEKFKEKLDD